jgi:hypothetical protein
MLTPRPGTPSRAGVFHRKESPMPNLRDLEFIRDLLTLWLKEHREICGDPNCKEPANLLAWLAHCLGLRSDRHLELRDEIAFYEATCIGCQHLRN